jgi:hypothetical protein
VPQGLELQHEHGRRGGDGGRRGGPSKTKGKAEFVNYSFDVQFEGKNVARSFDLMLHNDKNTPPFPLLQGPVVALGGSKKAPVCPECGEEYE